MLPHSTVHGDGELGSLQWHFAFWLSFWLVLTEHGRRAVGPSSALHLHRPDRSADLTGAPALSVTVDRLMLMPDPLIGVLALQGDVQEHVRALEAAGARTTLVTHARDIASIDAVVLPGGESSTMDTLLNIFDMAQPLRQAIASGMPAYGSCAGMILLADRIEGGIHGQQTIGGMDMTVRRNAFGRQVDSFEADVLVDQIGDGPFRTVFIRAPWVEEVGQGVQVLSRIPAVDTGGRAVAVGAGKIVAARTHNMLATAFHPEITGDTRIHQMFVQMVRGERTGWRR